MSETSDCQRPDGSTKVGYPNRKYATNSARSFQAKTGMRARAYRCPDCKRYHITSSPKRRDA